MPRAWKAHASLVLITLIWGATFVIVKSAVEQDATPLLFNFVRMTLAAAALGIFFHRELRNISRSTLFAGSLPGLFLWLGYEFQTSGLRLTTASKSAFITGISVILVPLLLMIFWGRKTSLWTALGVLSAFGGLFLLSVPASESALGDWGSVNRGDVLTLGCAVSFAFHIIFLGWASERFPLAQIGFLQIATAALLMGITAPLLENPHIVWSGRVVWAIVLTSLLATAAAFTIQAWAQRFVSPTQTALILSLEPVFAWMTSFVFLGEHLGIRAAVGAALILAGVLISELLGSTFPNTSKAMVETHHAASLPDSEL
jgi:drug/metabolite transporter (DMT)-like permease